MPKTSIYKYRQSLSVKSKVRFSGQRNMSAPATDSILTKKADKNQLCVFVPPTSDKGHYLGAFFLCPDIGHKLPSQTRSLNLQVNRDSPKNFFFGTAGFELGGPSPAGMKNVPRRDLLLVASLAGIVIAKTIQNFVPER
jgi:hypothetical protein